MGEAQRSAGGADESGATAHGDAPVLRRLVDLYDSFRSDRSGAVATYIPELARVDPDQFGVCLATLDGHLYEVGDSRRPFTIQSISKAFVYGLALADHGPEHVLRRVGVEPSGEAFNSIVFDERGNRPFNPMVNAGAIATTAMIRGGSYENRWARILGLMERFAGRKLAVDEAVFESEKSTGHRNRAIAYLELNAGMIEEPVLEHLDLYFRQCSILVDARDLAVMAATLANNGVNPLSGERALVEQHVRSVLSVMQSCGMYDFSGEWGFRVGMPAKSGVGGGIVAVLPGQFGVGTFSPRLDQQGNSARGIRVCEALSQRFNLHLFDSHPAATAAVRRTYSGSAARSKRMRGAHERAILARLGERIQVFELQGDLFFAALEQVSRQVSRDLPPQAFVVLDGRRVSRVDRSAAPVMNELRTLLQGRGARLLLANFSESALRGLTAGDGPPWPPSTLFPTADEAIDWCETALIASARGVGSAILSLAEMDIAAGLSAAEVARLAAETAQVAYADGDLIIRQGEASDALYMLAAGSATVRVATQGGAGFRRLAGVGGGVTFGEVALFDGGPRTADVVADRSAVCYVLPVARLRALTEAAPEIGTKLLLNVGRALSQRLRQANDAICALEG